MRTFSPWSRARHCASCHLYANLNLGVRSLLCCAPQLRPPLLCSSSCSTTNRALTGHFQRNNPVPASFAGMLGLCVPLPLPWMMRMPESCPRCYSVAVGNSRWHPDLALNNLRDFEPVGISHWAGFGRLERSAGLGMVSFMSSSHICGSRVIASHVPEVVMFCHKSLTEGGLRLT